MRYRLLQPRATGNNDAPYMRVAADPTEAAVDAMAALADALIDTNINSPAETHALAHSVLDNS